MKKLSLSIVALALITFSNQAIAQTEEKKEIRKEIKMEDEDGVITLTITTTENGDTKTEVFTGDDATKKMAELDKMKSGSTKTMFIGEDGKQHLKVEKRMSHDVWRKSTAVNN